MKTKSTHAITVAITSLALLVSAGCTREKSGDVSDRAGNPQSPASSASSDVPAMPPAVHDSLTSYPFEKREEFARQFNAMQAEFEAKMTELKQGYNASKAGDAGRAAMEALTTAESDFKKKISALGSATTDTWETARNNVTEAWTRLQATYERAKQSMAARPSL